MTERHTARPASLRLDEPSPAHLPALAELLSQLGYPETEGFLAQRLDQLHAHPDAWHRVAVDGERVLGFISLHFIPQLAVAGDFARVSYLCVAEGARGKRIGEMLLEAAAQAARRRGCDRLELHCDVRRTRAHRFYERLRFEDAPRYYRRALPGSGS